MAGQLGDGTTTNRLTPVQVHGPGGVGYLNLGTAPEPPPPLPIATPTVESGGNHTVALRDDGTVWAWGSNSFGQLGDGTTADRRTPVQVPNLNNITAIAAGWNHTLALESDGTLWAWGDNQLGQLGDGTTINRHTPRQINLNNVNAIDAGFTHTVALRNGGDVWAWGETMVNQWGLTPIRININNVTAIAAGGDHTVALRNDGDVWAWGSNNPGQLGDNTITNRANPIRVPNFSDAVAITAGERHTVALISDGTVWAWGLNNGGQLGDSTSTNRRTPVQVRGQNNIGFLCLGEWIPPDQSFHAVNVAVTGSGTVTRSHISAPDGTQVTITANPNANNRFVRWEVTSGGITIPAPTNISQTFTMPQYLTSMRVRDLRDISAITAGRGMFTVAIRSDGTVWAWGLNTSGQ